MYGGYPRRGRYGNGMAMSRGGGGRNMRPYRGGRMGAGPPEMERNGGNSGNYDQGPSYPMGRGGMMPDSGRSPRGLPSNRRPLARLTARAMNVRGPLSLGQSANAYRMEVNEIALDDAKNNEDIGPIPCVTVRDYRRITEEEVSQRRVCIPVAIVDNLAKSLNKCMGEDNRYNVELLEAQKLTCPKTKKVVEIQVDSENKRLLRSYLNAPTSDQYKTGDPQEVIELRSELIKRLHKFLHDVATRYRNVKGEMNVPSLFSYSGERRYYFDLRRTRWGLRLHVSQVTDMHRNVVGIPLESLVPFRDRLNQAIGFLRLEEEGSGGEAKVAVKPKRNNRAPRIGKRKLGKRGDRANANSKGESEKESTVGDECSDENSHGSAGDGKGKAPKDVASLEKAMNDVSLKTNGVSET